MARPFSANTYALSKVWFRCATVNLRETDMSAINSDIKRWLYADLLLKPEVAVLHRSVQHGGLSLTSVKQKALAYLLRTFMELAAHPAYINSLFLSTIYRVKVLEEENVCPLKIPPYYQQNFFDTLKTATKEGHEIVTMSTRDWYHYLLQQDITSDLPDPDLPRQLKPCRVERFHPDTDWCQVWSKVRNRFVDSATTTTAWQLVHQLLPCES